MANTRTNASLGATHEALERRIYLVRGHRVMIDEDLAELYGVGTNGLTSK